jgi:hypothetical protein
VDARPAGGVPAVHRGGDRGEAPNPVHSPLFLLPLLCSVGDEFDEVAPRDAALLQSVEEAVLGQITGPAADAGATGAEADLRGRPPPSLSSHPSSVRPPRRNSLVRRAWRSGAASPRSPSSALYAHARLPVAAATKATSIV